MPILVRELMALYHSGGDDRAALPVRAVPRLSGLARRAGPGAGRAAWRGRAGRAAGADVLAPRDRAPGPPCPSGSRSGCARPDGRVHRRARAPGLTSTAWSRPPGRCCSAGYRTLRRGVRRHGLGPAAELAGGRDMVGLFINTLPLRLRLPPAEPLVGAAAATCSASAVCSRTSTWGSPRSRAGRPGSCSTPWWCSRTTRWTTGAAAPKPAGCGSPASAAGTPRTTR